MLKDRFLIEPIVLYTLIITGATCVCIMIIYRSIMSRESPIYKQIYFVEVYDMMNNKENNNIDFDKFNNLVDNGMKSSDYDTNIGENENYNSKKNVRPNLFANGINESPNDMNNHHDDNIGRNENYNSKKSYSDNSGYNNRGRENYGYSQHSQEPKPSRNRLKSMYVINLTTTRMGIVLGVIFSIILIMFIAGFQIGSNKNENTLASSSSNANEELLFRSNASKDIINIGEANSLGQSSAHTRSNEPTRTDIVSMDLLSENKSNTQNVAADDISSMINRDLQDMGQSLNSRSQAARPNVLDANQNTQSIQSTKDDLLSSYMSSEPASYIPGEKSTASSSVSTSSQPTTTKTATTSTSAVSTKTSENGLVYYIQVAVAGAEKTANTERDYLRSKNFTKAYVVDGIAKDGSTMYKLKIGRYATRAQADQALALLKSLSSKYADSYIYSDKAS